MRMLSVVPAIMAGCAAAGDAGAAGADPDEDTGGRGAFDRGRVAGPHGRCARAPDAGPTREFRHITSKGIALGSPKHRGVDLVTAAGSATQTLEGWASYSVIDKALEDEDVELFACGAGRWQRVGAARTDDEGRF